jgi:hypothetical protein
MAWWPSSPWFPLQDLRRGQWARSPRAQVGRYFVLALITSLIS